MSHFYSSAVTNLFKYSQVMSSKAKDILLAMGNSALANLAKAHDINLALAEFPVAEIISLASAFLALALRLVEEKNPWGECRRQRSLQVE